MAPRRLRQTAIGNETMRFLFKITILLFVVSFFLPHSPVEAEGGGAPSTMALVFGAQQAIHDLGSFCERAPAACEAGGGTLRYAGERVGAGFSYLASLAGQQMAAGFAGVSADPAPTVQEAPLRVAVPSVPSPATNAVPRPTPVNTQAPVPRPYTPPRAAGEGGTLVELRP